MVAARLANFFGPKAKPRHAMPEGTRVYAVGDVHGCLDELNRLLDAIDDDLSQSDVQSHLIFLGDLVDRGPQSAGVIERIVEGALPAHRRDCLMGNHEEVMLDCYKGRRELSTFGCGTEGFRRSRATGYAPPTSWDPTLMSRQPCKRRFPRNTFNS